MAAIFDSGPVQSFLARQPIFDDKLKVYAYELLSRSGLNNFFDGIENRSTVIEDSVFGFRAAGPALICNDCLTEERIVHWDPADMKLVG